MIAQFKRGVPSVTPEEQVNLIHYMFREWQATKKEQLVLQALLQTIAAENPPFASRFESILAKLRCSEGIQAHLDARFEGFGELLPRLVGEESLEKMVREFHLKYGAKLPVH
jgi:hypothetical protein